MQKYERWNWDSPILVSPHKPERLFFASQRVWKSENRGDSWEPISGDLTRDEERLDLPIMGRRHGWDNSWDVKAMSNYNTITSISESPVREGVIYAGTDDGIIQYTVEALFNQGKTATVKIKNMYGLELLTNQDMYSYLRNLEQIAKQNKNTNIYNLCSRGAAIEGIKSLSSISELSRWFV